jgi:hypothetical protein
MTIDVERKACELMQINGFRLQGLGSLDDDVASQLALDILDSDDFDTRPDHAIVDGVSEAFEEIDCETHGLAQEAVQRAVEAEVQHQAKAIALRLLRELAAKARTSEAQAAEAVVA